MKRPVSTVRVCEPQITCTDSIDSTDTHRLEGQQQQRQQQGERENGVLHAQTSLSVTDDHEIRRKVSFVTTGTEISNVYGPHAHTHTHTHIPVTE